MGTDTTTVISTQPPMPDAQSKLVSKVSPEKNLAAVVIQTDSHSKLWMVTELAADPEPTTPNFLTVAPTDKLKPTVKSRKTNLYNYHSCLCFMLSFFCTVSKTYFL